MLLLYIEILHLLLFSIFIHQLIKQLRVEELFKNNEVLHLILFYLLSFFALLPSMLQANGLYKKVQSLLRSPTLLRHLSAVNVNSGTESVQCASLCLSTELSM